MVRRLGRTTVALVMLVFGGASAGPATPLQSLRLIVSVAWLIAPDEVTRETRPLTPHVPQPSVTTASRAPRSAGFRPFPVERWLFQRPPPSLL